MYTVKQGGDIHRGDLVAVANGNDFNVGIYFGNGRGGTFQYYYVAAPKQSKEWFDKSNQEKVSRGLPPDTWKLSKVWKNFVNTPRDTRILKLNRENITDRQTIEDIEKAKEILQEFNITVNY